MEIEITTLTIKMEILPEFFSVIFFYHIPWILFPPLPTLLELYLPHFSLLPPVPLPPLFLPGSHPVALPIV